MRLDMSRRSLDRRQFLTLPLALLLAPVAGVRAAGEPLRGAYEVSIGLLYNTLRFHLAGSSEERIDRGGGRYDVKLVGTGADIANRVESTGVLREGRWAPIEAASWFQVRGRESHSRIVYDHGRSRIEYHFRGETFFLRRLRVVDDVFPMPERIHVDDVVSAMLNYADNQWPVEADGSLQTHVVRRRRRQNEGVDDVDKNARAELVSFSLKPTVDPATGKPTALFDLTRFSSWAREGQPGRIVFGPARRPELIVTSLMMGTSVTIRVNSG